MNTPDNITKLELGQVFVFGSNTSGHHAGGAARLAYEKFGAIWGRSHGFQGASYAIPTLGEGVTLSTIRFNVWMFLDQARMNKNLTFLVTKVGCGIAGWPEESIKQMFKNVPSNVCLPEGWEGIVVEEVTVQQEVSNLLDEFERKAFRKEVVTYYDLAEVMYILKKVVQL